MWYNGALESFWRKLFRIRGGAATKAKDGIHSLVLLILNPLILFSNVPIKVLKVLQNDRTNFLSLWPLYRRPLAFYYMRSRMPALWKKYRRLLPLTWNDAKDEDSIVPLGLAGKL